MNISGVTVVSRKTHKGRHVFLLSLFLLIIVSIVAVLVISAYAGWSLTHPKRKEIPKFSSNIALEYRDVEFKDANNKINLKGWYFKAKDSDKTVILAHGYAQNRMQFNEKTLDMVKKFQEKGYNMLLFDFRNSGMSGGNSTTIGIYEQDDLNGAVKFVKNQGSKHIVLMGYSMGAAASIAAAAGNSDVDAVIADSSYADLAEYLNDNLNTFTKGLPAFPFNKTILTAVGLMLNLDPKKMSPEKDIARIAPRPVILIHGVSDRTIPVGECDRLSSAYSSIASDKITVWKVSGAKHVESYEMYPDEYIRRVFDFLDRVYTK
jgi:fermentation-respiration switch protein FrsA (DUF1100 family)